MFILPSYPVQKAVFDEIYSYAATIPDLHSDSIYSTIELYENGIYTHDTIYKLFPRDPEIPMGGYVTENKIFFMKGDDDNTICISKGAPCTWISQPYCNELADHPTLGMVYDFLKWPTLEFFLVGKEYVWRLSKTEKTLQYVKNLLSFEDGNQISLFNCDEPEMDSILNNYYRNCLEYLSGTSADLFLQEKNILFRRDLLESFYGINAELHEI